MRKVTESRCAVQMLTGTNRIESPRVGVLSLSSLDMCCPGQPRALPDILLERGVPKGVLKEKVS